MHRIEMTSLIQLYNLARSALFIINVWVVLPLARWIKMGSGLTAVSIKQVTGNIFCTYFFEDNYCVYGQEYSWERWFDTQQEKDYSVHGKKNGVKLDAINLNLNLGVLYSCHVPGPTAGIERAPSGGLNLLLAARFASPKLCKSDTPSL